MTPEQLVMVRETAAKLEDAGEDFARRFYGCLFELHPPARVRFSRGLRQGGAFLDELLFLATAAGDLPVFVQRARELGRRQQGSGVQTTDYAFLGEALLHAAREVAGDDWTPEVADSWRRLFALVSETMLEGAAAGLFRSRGAAQGCPPGRPGG